MKEYPIKVKSKHIKDNMFEVEGVIIYAESMIMAIKKWCRTKKPRDVEPSQYKNHELT